MAGNLTTQGRSRVLGLYKPGFQSDWSDEPWKYLVLELVDLSSGQVSEYQATVSWSTPTTETFVYNTSAVTFSNLDTNKHVKAIQLAYDQGGGNLVKVARYEFGMLMAHTGSFTIGAGQLRLVAGGTQAAASILGTLKLAYTDPVNMEGCYNDTPSDEFTVIGLNSSGGTVFSVTVPEAQATVDTGVGKVTVQASWQNTSGSDVQVAQVVLKRNNVEIHRKDASFTVENGKELVLTLEVLVS